MNAQNATQPTIETPYVSQQPTQKKTMTTGMMIDDTPSKQQEEVLRLRGGCPGRFCGLPILPCRCDICIFPIPCC
ncbi:hypothetical protein DB88DRAFT_481387 [Papiliotrema laurentii]|uniref:Uncharacterized protein n=1 Tax=Papiliotrema laurentii TaxID=5418 RepID=A0AAD9L8H9_PAPLA|nr:hypothetical protein DB88DRAFT_481387 [Papiliotrema laurentii]